MAPGGLVQQKRWVTTRPTSREYPNRQIPATKIRNTLAVCSGGSLLWSMVRGNDKRSLFISIDQA